MRGIWAIVATCSCCQGPSSNASLAVALPRFSMSWLWRPWTRLFEFVLYIFLPQARQWAFGCHRPCQTKNNRLTRCSAWKDETQCLSRFLAEACSIIRDCVSAISPVFVSLFQICFSEQILPQHFIHQPRPSHFDFGGNFKHGLAGLHRILDLCFFGGKPQTQSHSSSSEIRVIQECHYSGSFFWERWDLDRSEVWFQPCLCPEHHAKGLSHFAKGPDKGPLSLPLQADGADESPDSREPPCTVKEPPEKRRKIIQELETVRNCLADAYEALGRLTVLLDAVVDWSKCGPGKKAVLQSAPWKLYVHARVQGLKSLNFFATETQQIRLAWLAGKSLFLIGDTSWNGAFFSMTSC